MVNSACDLPAVWGPSGFLSQDSGSPLCTRSLRRAKSALSINPYKHMDRRRLVLGLLWTGNVFSQCRAACYACVVYSKLLNLPGHRV